MDSKLDSSAYNNYYKGTYTTLGNLQSRNATSTVGSYALVDGGSGQSAVIYVWDARRLGAKVVQVAVWPIQTH